MSVSIRQRITAIAEMSADRPAVVGFDENFVEQVLTWRELAERSGRRADALVDAAARETGPGVVAIEANNTIQSVVDIVAVLSAELPLLPLNPASPVPEREKLLNFIGQTYGRAQLIDAEADADADAGRPARSPAAMASRIAYLLPTGGSSGRPKIAIRPGPLGYDPHQVPLPLRRRAGWRAGQRQLILGPLHHAAPFTTLLDGLLDGNTTILPPYFLPGWTVELVERYAVEWIQLTPAHMRTILMLRQPDPASFASVRTVMHTAASCDSFTKKRWIEMVGPQHLYEVYSSTENIGGTLVRGDEWQQRPGTVGRGFFTKISIRDDAGNRLGPGQTGKVFMRAGRVSRGDAYLGSQVLETTADGFASVGDFGWLDADGYLFLAPRRHDVINVGGEKVYPNEVEAQLLEHPAVLDAVVVAAEDQVLGSTVGAYVVCRPGASVSTGELMAHCRAGLVNYKVPTRITFVDQVPRSAAGKLERWRLAGQRG
ncbi:class I adenylate-forming enzyme family protein [Micromonospora sp. NPDC048898]|uniref:class I adenylate-forming enzyme family protein n=1 Tax=Micromonospora sp. NPDC048898 TaxID=3364260 RepID=UPI003721A781